MSTTGRWVPSEAEWQRLSTVFGTFFAMTVVVAVIFMVGAPFPRIVSAIIMSPIVIPTAWIYFMVIRQRDLERLDRLRSFALRHRRKPRRRR
jgi:hypothetical protein